MTLPNSTDDEPDEDLGFAMIPIWLLRDERVHSQTKLLYVALTAFQTGTYTPYNQALEHSLMEISKLEGEWFDQAFQQLHDMGLLRLQWAAERGADGGDEYMIATHEGGLL